MEKEKVNFENCFEEVIKRLKENAYTISTDFMRDALEEGQENKYKNLVNALSSTLDLIDRYSWQTKWSKFRDENGKQFVSIWEQDINGQIRNNNTFLVDEVAFKIGNKFSIDTNGNMTLNDVDISTL